MMTMAAWRRKLHIADLGLVYVLLKTCMYSEAGIYHVSLWWPKDLYEVQNSVLLYSIQELTLEDNHLRTIDGWYFRSLGRCMGIRSKLRTILEYLTKEFGMLPDDLLYPHKPYFPNNNPC